MKGFGIYVKNNLLEPKHVENMGESIWLYLWLLDKMTSVNENGIGKVLGGQPVSAGMLQDELGLSERTYRRWVDKLRSTGYIRTLRTPYGLVITVSKAEKIFSKKRAATSGTSKVKEERPQMAEKSEPVRPKVAKRSAISAASPAKSGTSNKTIQDNTKTIQNTTNVVEPPARYGKPEINELFDHWAEQCGYNIETRVKANRAAASNLFKKYGVDGVKRLIDGVALAQGDRYAPNIGDFSELQSKLPQLIVWGKKKHTLTGVETIS
jgi:hypothetical protein